MRTQIVTRTRRAFTLIEILIVVVILGILAAIVIPQFTDASEDAMEASVRSQLQTVRAQIELFRVKNPTIALNAGNLWTELVTGDYLQQAARNPLLADPAQQTAVAAAAGVGVAWVMVPDDPLTAQNESDFFACDGLGQLFDEDGDGNPG